MISSTPQQTFRSSMEKGKDLGSHGLMPPCLGIMVVDDNPKCLSFVKTMLQMCNYRVETFQRASDALYTLWERRTDFDLVLTEVHISGMSGFKLLERIVAGTDIPVITMSSDNDPKTLTQALTSGAVFHMVKPITIASLDVVWQKAWRNKVDGAVPPESLIYSPMKTRKPTSSLKEKFVANQSNGAGRSSSKEAVATKAATKKDTSSKRKRYGKKGKENDDSNEEKKPRLQWDYELHHRFLVAVTLLGKPADTIPQNIHCLMNVEGLTMKQISSHLQKHRQRVVKTKQLQAEKKNSKKSVPSPYNSRSIFPRRHVESYSNSLLHEAQPLTALPSTVPASKPHHTAVFPSLLLQEAQSNGASSSTRPVFRPRLPTSLDNSFGHPRQIHTIETNPVAPNGGEVTSLPSFNQMNQGGSYQQDAKFGMATPVLPPKPSASNQLNSPDGIMGIDIAHSGTTNWGVSQQPMVLATDSYGGSSPNIGNLVPSHMESLHCIADSANENNSTQERAFDTEYDEWPGLDAFLEASELTGAQKTAAAASGVSLPKDNALDLDFDAENFVFDENYLSEVLDGLDLS